MPSSSCRGQCVCVWRAETACWFPLLRLGGGCWESLVAVSLGTLCVSLPLQALVFPSYGAHGLFSVTGSGSYRWLASVPWTQPLCQPWPGVGICGALAGRRALPILLTAWGCDPRFCFLGFGVRKCLLWA